MSRSKVGADRSSARKDMVNPVIERSASATRKPFRADRSAARGEVANLANKNMATGNECFRCTRLRAKDARACPFPPFRGARLRAKDVRACPFPPFRCTRLRAKDAVALSFSPFLCAHV